MTRYQFIEQVAATEQVLCRGLHVSTAASAAFRAMPSGAAPGDCKQNYALKGTPWGATRCAAGYVGTACGR